jgi:DnaJ-class molecular chaperone
MFEKYYQVLELHNNASDEEVKKAYKKMAVKYHPDKHANSSEQEKKEAEENFKKIADAYDVLTNKEKHMPSFAKGNFRRGSIDPHEIFNQIFKDMNIGRQMNGIHRGMNVSINMPVNMNRVMRSSSISIVNGRRVETINETINGVTRQQTIVSDLNNGTQQMHGNIQNIIFRHM